METFFEKAKDIYQKFIAWSKTTILWKKGIPFAICVVVIAAAVVFALNPTKQLAKFRNSQRRNDILKIIDALYQYSTENKEILASLPNSSEEICKPSSQKCSGVDLSKLIDSQKYLSSMPTDPGNKKSDGIGYSVMKTESGRITVSAPFAEMGATISITR